MRTVASLNNSFSKFPQTGFTLLELLVVLAIIGIFASIVLAGLSVIREDAYEARAKSETRSFASALQTYIAVEGNGYPPDANRGIPAGLEDYLSGGGWPDGPWPGSVYDWDAWEINGESVRQISVRFCPHSGSLSECRFPRADWAENFGVNSAFFYCFEGPCRSHSGEPRDYPGYCINCVCKEMEEC